MMPVVFCSGDRAGREGWYALAAPALWASHWETFPITLSLDVGYQNKLSLNSLPFAVNGADLSLATTPDWNEALINARTSTLVEMVINANLLPGETQR